MKIQRIKTIVLLGALATLCFTTRAQEQPDADRLRRQAKELIAKAHDLKADGNSEASEKLVQEGNELLRKADRLNERRRESDATPAPRRERGPDQDRMRPPRSDREEGMTPRDDRRSREESDRFQPQLRRYHLKRAIWHLRAAGLFEQADRLEQRLQASPERFRSERRMDREPREPREPRQPQERGEREERRDRDERR